jgi:hypothetical protein
MTMNVKHIAATLAILGSASFTLTGCKKDSTEVPAADGAKKGDGSCGANKDGSCGAKKEGGDAPAADAPAADAPAADAPAEAPAP